MNCVKRPGKRVVCLCPQKRPKRRFFYFNKSLGLSSEYPEMTISESGLYALVLRSRKPEARKFAK
ncbi:BRO family protein [Comamonas thiooxydans]|uniref:BRO family protein n=1 Tax=Comamonas thiooxydans TaxID=363952 RepID=UPI0005106414|nr:BRO family protein [Comamonas thiooxydans]KGG87819.1 hypothetical protein P609_06910 [Comamonas thiooxydans]